jgi:prophage tail gpP-like protein
MEVLINGKRLKYINDVDINLSYNSIADSFSFSAYFDPTTDKNLFKPSRYSIVQLVHRGVLILTGRILEYTFKSAGNPPQSLLEVSGASITEVLAVSPVVTTPLQNNGLKIVQIAEKVCRHYGIKVVVDDEVKSDCDRVLSVTIPKVDGTVKDYLDSITKQFQIVLSHNALGHLLLTRVKADKIVTTIATKVKPVALKSEIEGPPEFITVIRKERDRDILFKFTEGTYLGMSLSFNGTDMHSDIMVIGQSQPDSANSVQNVPFKNPYVETEPVFYAPLIPDEVNRGVRPLTVIQTIGDATTLPLTSRAEVGRELKAITLSIDIEGWTLDGHLVTPNQIVEVINPFVHLYKYTKWLIKDVKLTATESSMTATLTCCLPECFNNEPITNIFNA